MKIIQTIIILFLITFSNGIAQELDCYVPDDLGDTKSASWCSLWQNYSLAVPEYTPVKTVRVAFHVVDTLGVNKKNFVQGQSTYNFFNSLLNAINYSFQNVDSMNPSVATPYIPDAKIQFQLEGIYFHEHDTLWRTTATNFYYEMIDFGHALEDNLVLNNPAFNNIQKYHTLHTFFILKYRDDGSCIFGGYSVPETNVVVLQCYNSYTSDYVRGHICHEFGHALGLHHTWVGCSDDGNACRSCSTRDSTNNYMSYASPPTKRKSFSDCQIATMHKYLMYNTISDCLVSDYCMSEPTSTISVSNVENILWDSQKYLHGNVNVYGSLTINCLTSIPEDSQVAIYSNGKLIIDEGEFDNACSDNWEGIIVNNGGYLEIYDTYISDYGIIVKAGGTIRVIDDLLITNECAITVESGGYICVDNGASITLQDPLSLIKLHSGFNAGVNTSYISDPSTCLSNLENITFTGNGSIVDYSQDVYIQNETLSSDQYIGGINIYIGDSVTTSKPYGDVNINNNSSIFLDAENNVIIESGFEVSSGSSFEIVN